jgi:MSHA biogenesis protein MshP
MFPKKSLILTKSPRKLPLKSPRKLGKCRSPNQQTGSALVIAIFVIIVLSALGAALVKVLDSSQESVGYEVLGTRAYTVAQSGLQWQLGEVFPLDSPAIACADIDNPPPDNPPRPSFNHTLGYAQCEVSVSCSDFDRENGIRYYTITATGTCAIGSESTSRKIAVKARSLSSL